MSALAWLTVAVIIFDAAEKVEALWGRTDSADEGVRIVFTALLRITALSFIGIALFVVLMLWTYATVKLIGSRITGSPPAKFAAWGWITPRVYLAVPVHTFLWLSHSLSILGKKRGIGVLGAVWVSTWLAIHVALRAVFVWYYIDAFSLFFRDPDDGLVWFQEAITFLTRGIGAAFGLLAVWSAVGALYVWRVERLLRGTPPGGVTAA